MERGTDERAHPCRVKSSWPKRRMTDSKIASARKLLTSGVPPREMVRNLSVSVPTLYRWIPASSQA